MLQLFFLLILLITEAKDQVHDEYLVGDDQYHIKQPEVLLCVDQTVNEGDQQRPVVDQLSEKAGLI